MANLMLAGDLSDFQEIWSEADDVSQLGRRDPQHLEGPLTVKTQQLHAEQAQQMCFNCVEKQLVHIGDNFNLASALAAGIRQQSEQR